MVPGEGKKAYYEAERDLEKLRPLRTLYDRAERVVGALTGTSFDRLFEPRGTVDPLLTGRSPSVPGPGDRQPLGPSHPHPRV